VKLLVADLMTEKTVFRRAGDSLEALYDAMGEYGIRHIPIVDSEQKVIGVVSQLDLFRSCLYLTDQLHLSQVREYLRNTLAQEVMSRSVETIDPSEPIREAGLKMLENKFSCLPVVEGEKLIGILTESDFVRYLSQP